LNATLYHDTDFSITGIYETLDGGATWAKLGGCAGGALPPITSKTRITLDRSGNRLYAAYRTPDTYTVYRTTSTTCVINGRIERAWEQGWSTTGDTARSLFNSIYADPTNQDYVYVTGVGFWVSNNGGMSFSQVSGPHADQHGFAVDPTNHTVIFTANDGGLYRSSNRGATGTWSFIGEGLFIAEFYDGTHAVTEPNLIIGGTQDNGTDRYDGTSTVWTSIRGGDGATVDIDPTDAKIQYSMGQYATSIDKSSKRGDSWTKFW
jgi:hypothetical protein